MDRCVLYVNKSGIIQLNNVNQKKIGEKAFGLLSLPEKWTLPFFVVSKNMYRDYILSGCDVLSIKKYIDNILKTCKKLDIHHSKIIIRSSGIEESIYERGKYESQVADISNLTHFFVELFKILKKSNTVLNNSIPFIIQKYVTPTIIGHMSNERRLSQEIRDWKIEYNEYNSEKSFKSDSLGIRHWRKEISLENLIIDTLTYTNTKGLKNNLLPVAEYYYSKTERRHLEFVCENDKLYIVQADMDQEIQDSLNPTSFNIKIQNHIDDFEPEILKRITDEMACKYNKIKNVFVYKESGFKTVPIFILDDEDTILNLSKGIMNCNLKNDLEKLVSLRPVVIRSDISSDISNEHQLLPRSPELHTVKDLQEWLFCNVNKFDSLRGLAFIFHNFVPAISAAFAHAAPDTRKVEIQALWGLPEGLYYNSHDTILVDVGRTVQGSFLTENAKIIKKKLSFKNYFVTPLDDGTWGARYIAKPYDWKCSIQDDLSIKEIAVESKKIANFEKKELSIMWFVGIDKSFYGTLNLPWYHEEYDIKKYTPEKFKKKYFYDEEYVIHSKNDINLLDQKNSNIKLIRIQPEDDQTLRDKNFIHDVGNYAVKNNITIYLEGAILSHAFYQLNDTGAKVVIPEQTNVNFSNEIEFNKLVRDNIPKRIIDGGENVLYGYVDGFLYNRLLIEKLYEECFEIADTNSDNDLIEELADAYEVCERIRSLVVKDKYENYLLMNTCPKLDKLMSITNLVSDLPFLSTIESDYVYNFLFEMLYGYIIISRKKGELHIEISISNKLQEISGEENEYDDIYEKKSDIVSLSSKILSMDNSNDLISSINKIEELIISVLTYKGLELSLFDKIRNDKNEKAGAFENGYVLKETNLQKIKQIDNPIHLKQIKRPKYKYCDLSFNQKTNTKRLLLRAHVPLAFNNWSITFNNEKIHNMFSKFNGVNVNLSRRNGQMFYSISLINNALEQYEQLKL